MVVGWLQLGSDWYYMNGSGAMLTGWQKIGGTWYYLNTTTGKMATGWTTVGGSKYYMNGSGAMLTDWQNIDGSEYYFYSSGAMAVSTVIGGVEIGADGKASRTESQAIGTLTKFLKTMIQPVGNTLYVWGGGHDAWTDGDGLRIGMNRSGNSSIISRELRIIIRNIDMSIRMVWTVPVWSAGLSTIHIIRNQIRKKRHTVQHLPDFRLI